MTEDEKAIVRSLVAALELAEKSLENLNFWINNAKEILARFE